MQPTPTISGRQLWGQLNTRTPEGGTREWCTPVILPTGGVLVFGENLTTRLTARATYLLPCNSDESIISPDTTGNSTVLGFYEPFYASISPQVFALATATVISYVLVILIFITPRTFYVGGPGGGGGFLSRHGLSTSTSVVGVGRRPLLQKVATIGVATSLTIAAADTFHVAHEQYNQGYLDSSALVDDVVNTVLIRVVRIISDSFIWLAQVQTLIRLFPRHKEKVTIKWLGFALVSADVIFSILDSFISDSPGTRPRSFTDAIPALNYLFELAISLIYASCVIYYSLSKRRFAFWHPKMRNICLVALMSYIAILIPVVFFVLDISLRDIAGWGEYIRWVGAAAASVVVWEWVERIEALERDERKDGILGREIFDGDEMLDRPSSDESDFRSRRRGRGDGDVEKSAGILQQIKNVRTKLPVRRRRKRPLGHAGESRQGPPTGGTDTTTGEPLVPPGPAISPPDRSDTASAASTVYAVRYHNLTSPSPAAPEPVPEDPEPAVELTQMPKDISDSSTEDPSMMKEEGPAETITAQKGRAQQFWSNVSNPFKRRRAEPPAEVAGAQIASGLRRSPIDRTINLKDRLGAFATAQRDRFGRNGSGPSPPLPVMVIPAPKGRTWSPEEVRNSSSISSTSQAAHMQMTEGEAGPSGHSRQVSSATDTTETTTNSDNVVVIPAPRRGQTWSPPQASGSQSRTPTQQIVNQERQSPAITSSPQQQLRSQVSRSSTADSQAHGTRGALAEAGSATSPRMTPQSRARQSPSQRRNTQSRRTPPVQLSAASQTGSVITIPAPARVTDRAPSALQTPPGSRTEIRDFSVQNGGEQDVAAVQPSSPRPVEQTQPPASGTPAISHPASNVEVSVREREGTPLESNRSDAPTPESPPAPAAPG